jgi:outer membrane translocation and assembly module TamA
MSVCHHRTGSPALGGLLRALLAGALAACAPVRADVAGLQTQSVIPVPLIDADPNTGLTVGLIPTWLQTDGAGNIRRIIAPDVNYNPDFGFGAHARLLSYPSDDTQWSIVAGGQARVEHLVDYEYQTGRLRSSDWTIDAGAVDDRDGSPRFYGIGNHSRLFEETNYTSEQRYLRAMLGLNLSHEWQLSLTLRARDMEVMPGTLATIPSIQVRYPGLDGLGSQEEFMQRLQLTYDDRDDPTVPRRGGAWTVYGAAASGLYSAVGFDVRQLWTADGAGTIAAHAAARYMPGATDVPFWSLSSLGGDQSAPGESQPLRGYGTSRFCDRNSFVTNLEYRGRLLELDALSTHIEIELTPFVDIGDVFAHSRASPFHDLHRVAGLGIRGIARPNVVGYLDVGYGREGAAAFTGISYPF